jgi:hypothetical protein
MVNALVFIEVCGGLVGLAKLKAAWRFSGLVWNVLPSTSNKLMLSSR